ncbi:MAG TPA: hypothetical protein PKY31_14290 [Spirochaetota bacterium]|nr:hypothetical protein [Spirochaetota bacterium]
MSSSNTGSFCRDGSCEFFRKHDTLYRELIDSNVNNEKNIYSFRHFISC